MLNPNDAPYVRRISDVPEVVYYGNKAAVLYPINAWHNGEVVPGVDGIQPGAALDREGVSEVHRAVEPQTQFIPGGQTDPHHGVVDGIAADMGIQPFPTI